MTWKLFSIYAHFSTQPRHLFTLDKPQSRVVCHSATSPAVTPDLCHHLITVLSVERWQDLCFGWAKMAYSGAGGGLHVRIAWWQDCEEMIMTLRITIDNGTGPHCFHEEDQNFSKIMLKYKIAFLVFNPYSAEMHYCFSCLFNSSSMGKDACALVYILSRACFVCLQHLGWNCQHCVK